MSHDGHSLSAMVSPEALADARLRALDAHAIVSIGDAQGRFTYVNDQFCQSLGYDRSALIGQRYEITDSGLHPPEFFSTMRAQVKSGRSWVGEVSNRAHDGRLVWFEAIIVPLFGTDGEVNGFFSVRKDITKRKQSEDHVKRSEQFLLDVAELAQVGGWSLDLRSGELYWSEQTKRIHGVAPDFVPDLATAINFYAPEARAAITHAVDASILSGESWDLELPLITAKGGSIWVRAIGHALHENGEAVSLVGAFQNITKRKLVEDVLREEVQQRHSAEQLLRDVVESIPDAVAAFDHEDRLIICNSAFLKTYAASADAIQPGVTFESILRFGLARGQFSDAGNDKASQEAWLAKRLRDHKNPPDQLTQRLRDGTWLQVREHRTPAGATVGVRTDISSLKRAESELRKYAEMDPLTGLMNRRSFSLRLNQLLDNETQATGSGSCVALFDIDHFKPINDAYGHDIGDEVLVELAKRLRERISPQDFAARLGGDEFVFVLARRSDRDAQEAVFIDLFDAVRAPIMTSIGKVSISISLGAVEIDDADLTSRQLMKFADLAQYRAKQKGRGTWCWFTSKDAAQHRRETGLGKALAAAMGAINDEDSGLAFALLPLCDAQDGEHLGYSSAPSWTHGDMVLEGDELFALAQKSGQIAQLCTQVIEAAMAAVGDAQARGAHTGQLWLTASADHVKLDPFFATVEDLRIRHGLEAASVTIAVEEQALTERSSAALEKTLQRLGQAGYRIGVDQFGSRASSLATMQTLGVSAVRLDRRVSDRLADPQADDRLARGLVAMAGALDIEVVATSVASPHHAARLALLGIAALQGPLVGAPVRPDAMPEHLAGSARRRLEALLNDVGTNAGRAGQAQDKRTRDDRSAA